MTVNDTLTSKLQYKNYEPGEFAEEKKRTYSEILQIIDNFPWHQQRENVHIGLTCPSVTLQTESGTFIKFTLYYNQKFILYFFNGKNLYSKSFLKKEDVYPFILNYFEKEEIDISLLKKEKTTWISVKEHFTSNSFTYLINKKGFWHYLRFFTWLQLSFFAFVMVQSITNRHSFEYPVLAILILLIFLIPVGGVISVWLTINYYNFSKGKFLRLSKGADSFTYGETGNAKVFYKKDILTTLVEKNTSSRCPWGSFTLTTIFFADGQYIVIPSIMLSADEIKQKIPGVAVETDAAFIPYYS